ncbi:Methyltransferase-like protein 24 [Armadillidium vulgare]|nr:Methyltransferase-like protein 24 [Armadillidium vulgare]
MDNDKNLCLDSDVLIHSKNCTVYSFGAGDDITFDFWMTKYGCEVHMFDPSVNSSEILKEIKKYKNLYFHQLGLSNKRKTYAFHWKYLDEDRKETVEGVLDTYANIKKEINHENVPVQYLKMDIEGSEWEALPIMFKNGDFQNVQQFAIEIHAKSILNKTEEEAVSLLQGMWNILLELRKLGFQRVSYEGTPFIGTLYRTPNNEAIPTCGEIFYIRRP